MLCPRLSLSSPLVDPLWPQRVPTSPLVDSLWPQRVPTSSLVDPLWPLARSLWPDTRPIFYSVEQEVLRHLQEMRQNMEAMDRLHQKIFEQIDQTFPRGPASFLPVAVERLGSDSDGPFAVSLDTSEFRPEELSVKQVGNRLRVSGKTEKRQEDGNGSFSYRCEEFRQELLLPLGVDPASVSCSLVGGRLQISAPRNRDGQERVVPITLSASCSAISKLEDASCSAISKPEDASCSAISKPETEDTRQETTEEKN